MKLELELREKTKQPRRKRWRVIWQNKAVNAWWSANRRRLLFFKRQNTISNKIRKERLKRLKKPLLTIEPFFDRTPQ
jgi:hypothetical protein